MEDAEVIHDRIFSRRLDPNKPYTGWTFVEPRKIKPKGIMEYIQELQAQGRRVTGGYFTTGCRGWHEHQIMIKDL